MIFESLLTNPWIGLKKTSSVPPICFIINLDELFCLIKNSCVKYFRLLNRKGWLYVPYKSPIERHLWYRSQCFFFPWKSKVPVKAIFACFWVFFTHGFFFHAHVFTHSFWFSRTLFNVFSRTWFCFHGQKTPRIVALKRKNGA